MLVKEKRQQGEKYAVPSPPLALPLAHTGKGLYLWCPPSTAAAARRLDDAPCPARARRTCRAGVCFGAKSDLSAAFGFNENGIKETVHSGLRNGPTDGRRSEYLAPGTRAPMSGRAYAGPEECKK
ncbi:hypothetical protein HWV62_2535 [Athelia sp. TMB]|nr:hypothetical protein HWV62_2535 [Athelia sp. TMB]